MSKTENEMRIQERPYQMQAKSETIKNQANHFNIISHHYNHAVLILMLYFNHMFTQKGCQASRGREGGGPQLECIASSAHGERIWCIFHTRLVPFQNSVVTKERLNRHLLW